LMRCSAQTLIATSEKATFDLWRVSIQQSSPPDRKNGFAKG
jgi:hypothetical protein